MKVRSNFLRSLISALTVSVVCSMVSVAQVTTAAVNKSIATQATANKSMEEWRTKMIADWTRAKDYTKEYLDAMPEDGTSYKPNAQDKDMRTFAEQMLHLAANLYFLGSTATGTANPYQGKNLEKMDEYRTSKAALGKIVMESYDFMIATVRNMDLIKAHEPLKLFNRFDTTRSGAITAAFEHQTHHRGQTTIYIRMKGLKPPQEKLF